MEKITYEITDWNILRKGAFDMSTLENPIPIQHFTQEDIDRKINEIFERERKDFREFWRPLMQEQRRQRLERLKTESAGK